MERHTRNYFEAFGYDESSVILCEVCGVVGQDLHHIEPRSSFGSKRKKEQDEPSNLIALCREHHQMAHGPESRAWKERFKEIVDKRISTDAYKEECYKGIEKGLLDKPIKFTSKK